MTAMSRKADVPRKVKLTGGDIAFNIINHTVFILITLACIFPFYYLRSTRSPTTSWFAWARCSCCPRGFTLKTTFRS